MDFVEKDGNDKFRKVEFTVEPFETEMVGKQLTETYRNIKNHIFLPGCGDKTCQWCNFVLRNMPAKTVAKDEDAEEIFELNADIL
jgi:carbamoylphosphate synthase small subunit